MGETSDAARSRMIQTRTVVETMITVSPDGCTTVKTTKTIDYFVFKESRHLTGNQGVMLCLKLNPNKPWNPQSK